MVISNEQLEYETHLQFYKDLGHLSGDAEKDEYWHRQAEYLHVLSVCDAIRDAHLDAVCLGNRIADAEAKLQFHHGIGRRTKFIWLSLRHLLSLVHPGRTEPLPLDEVEQAAQALNGIYINIRGTLDNFAWGVLNLLAEQSARDLANKSPSTVDLFALKDPNLQDVAEFMNDFAKWRRKLKERRDPAAHRIPLSLPPAPLNEAQCERYIEVASKWDVASNAALSAARNGFDSSAQFERAEALSCELEQIGAFHPLFVHHPDKAPTKIYPAVPEDIGQLVKIARGLSRIILARLPT